MKNFFFTIFLFYIPFSEAGILKCELLEGDVRTAAIKTPVSIEGNNSSFQFKSHLEGNEYQADVHWNRDVAKISLSHKTSGLDTSGEGVWDWIRPFEAQFKVNLGAASLQCEITAEDGYSYPWKLFKSQLEANAQVMGILLDGIERLAKAPENSPLDRSKKMNAICLFIGDLNNNRTTLNLYYQLISLERGLISKRIFPEIYDVYQKLQMQSLGLNNFCVKDLYKDPYPIGFEDISGLLKRKSEIQESLAQMIQYLNQRFPNNGQWGETLLLK